MRCIGVLFLLLCYSVTGTGQQRFVSFTAADGLSQNTVTCIYQDRDGLLWLGTQDGLNSFDGHNFKAYRHDESDSTSISDQYILSITQDEEGYLWIATRNGYNRLQKATGKFERFYSFSNEKNILGLPYARISCNRQGVLLLDAGGRLQVFRPFTSGIVRRNLPDTLRHPVFDPYGNIWALSLGGRLVFLQQDKQFAVSGSFSIPAVAAGDNGATILRSDNRQLWYWDPAGRLLFFNRHSRRWDTTIINIPDAVNDIGLLADGSGWLCTLNGIYIIDTNKHIRHLQNTTGLPSGSILCAYQDQQHNIWMGSASAGLVYYHSNFDHFNTLSIGPVNDAAFCVTTAKPGAIWAGAGNGLYRLPAAGYSPVHLFPGCAVTAVTTDSSGHTWAAVRGKGIYELNEQGTILHSYTRDDSLLQSRKVFYLSCDSRNRVWVCSDKGAFMHDPATGKWISSFQSPGANQPSTGSYTLNAFEDREHRHWICKNMGIDVYDDDLHLLFRIQSDQRTSPVSRTIVTGCTQDAAGVIWIATLSNGIYTWQDGRLRHFTRNDGLTSDVVYSVNCDAKGRIWAVTTSGIHIFDTTRSRFYVLGPMDGLSASDYSLGALVKDQAGNMLIGSSEGVIVARASEVNLLNYVAEAVISNISINGINITSRQQPLVIRNEDQTLGFEFSLRQAIQPRQVIFQYRLPGVEENWATLPPNNTHIIFSRLPFGVQTLQVRAAYFSEDLAAAPITRFRIDVRPAFWQTWWFLALALTFGLLCIIAVVQVYNRRKYRKRMRELEVKQQLQQERERIARDLHDNIGAHTSALIAGINRIKKHIGDQETEMEEMSAYARNMMGYLRETIWVLNQQNISLRDFCDRFIHYASQVIKHYPAIQITAGDPEGSDRVLAPGKSLHLFRMLQEALQNACKHADASHIAFHSSAHDKMVFSLSDNGKGMQAGNRNREAYGLQNMRQRAAEAGFVLEIDSAPGTGTTIILREK